MVSTRIITNMKRVDQPLYDCIEINNDHKSFKFFQAPQSTQKPIIFTNLESSRKLSENKNFEIHAIRLILQYDTDPKDITEIAYHSWIRLWVGKTDLFVKISYFIMDTEALLKPEKSCQECKDASTDVVSVRSDRPDIKGIYVFTDPIDLIPNQNFSVELIFHDRPKLSKPVMASIYLSGFWKLNH